ncbi:unnamed protein product [Euphydryas editha]|uniref:Uncharacterized protein n=1 Tax=Euphydryas editha TaxID=104508 RepID=A0AAU9TU83_EUPED|nr:unnamed protein product [Euphydryas editha]
MPKRIHKTVLNSASRELVINLREYFEQELKNGRSLLPLTNVRGRVADALGIAKSTVSQITKEKFGESSMEENKLLTPNKKRRKNHPVTNPDSFNVDAIRNHIYGYYARNELPTLRKLSNSLREAELFEASLPSLSKLLRHKVGFRYQKADKRKVLMERTDIALARCDFLRKAKQIEDWDKVVF